MLDFRFVPATLDYSRFVLKAGRIIGRYWEMKFHFD